MPRKYPGKLILFGEYTVLNGGEVLAIPLVRYQASWMYGNNPGKNKNLTEYAQYLANELEELIDIKKFVSDLNQGLNLYSEIPQGYGAGSSGALVAAIFDRYANSSKKYSITGLRDVFSKMESFFHGKSSGIDPLVSYLNRIIRTQHSDLIEIIDKDLDSLLSGFHLVDSKMSKNTGIYVNIFKQNLKDKSFKKDVSGLKRLFQKTIENILLEGDRTLLSNQMRNISELQLKMFSPMIPDHIRTIWEKGLNTDLYYIKLCGSGGGGFFLLYATEKPALLDLIPII